MSLSSHVNHYLMLVQEKYQMIKLRSLYKENQTNLSIMAKIRTFSRIMKGKIEVQENKY